MQIRTALVLVLTATLTAACGSNYEAPPATAGANANGAAGVAPNTLIATAGVPPGTGKVLETMDADAYTYVKVDLGGKAAWAAAPKVAVNVGDTVTLPEGMPMRDFHSKTLDRTFELVYFLNGLQVAGGEIAEDLGGGERTHVASTGIAPGSIARIEGGQTIEEIISLAGELAGQDVAFRGRVVKFNGGIMGTNWMHIQDGTGATGTNDLTVTSAATVAVGDTVVVRGKLTTDKDFGAGYKYAVIVENAEVTKE